MSAASRGTDVKYAIPLVDDEVLGGRDHVDDLARCLVLHAQGDAAGEFAGDAKFNISLPGEHAEDH